MISIEKLRIVELFKKFFYISKHISGSSDFFYSDGKFDIIHDSTRYIYLINVNNYPVKLENIEFKKYTYKENFFEKQNQNIILTHKEGQFLSNYFNELVQFLFKITKRKSFLMRYIFLNDLLNLSKGKNPYLEFNLNNTFSIILRNFREEIDNSKNLKRINLKTILKEIKKTEKQPFKKIFIKKEYEYLKGWTVKQLKKYCHMNDIKVRANIKKDEIIKIIQDISPREKPRLKFVKRLLLYSTYIEKIFSQAKIFTILTNSGLDQLALDSIILKSSRNIKLIWEHREEDNVIDAVELLIADKEAHIVKKLNNLSTKTKEEMKIEQDEKLVETYIIKPKTKKTSIEPPKKSISEPPIEISKKSDIKRLIPKIKDKQDGIAKELPQISEGKENAKLIESLKERNINIIFYLCKKESFVKENKLTDDFFKWKHEYLDEFERIFDKKFEFDREDIILFCLWYENKEKTPVSFKSSLTKVFEESTTKKYIWRDKITSQFIKWEQKYVNKYIDYNHSSYRKWIENKINSLNEDSILKNRNSQDFSEWEWVFKEEYTILDEFEDFVNWYELNIERRIKPEIVPKEDLIKIKPSEIILPDIIKKGLSDIGWLGERYVFSRILPSKLLEQYPDGEMEEDSKGFSLKINNQVIAQVIWNNRYAESFMNYDLKLIEDNKEYFIEVKTTKTSETSFSISCIEMDFAKEKGENYVLYHIILVGNENMEYYKFKNFYKMYKDGFFDKKSISLKF